MCYLPSFVSEYGVLRAIHKILIDSLQLRLKQKRTPEKHIGEIVKVYRDRLGKHHAATTGNTLVAATIT